MRAVTLCLLAALCSTLVAGGVIDATDATFDEIVSKEFVLMEFYAPWCGHCKKLEPEFAKAAEELGDLAVLAKIDATQEKTSAQKYQIQGFPTIKIFRDGVLAGNYEGGRTASDFVKFVKANVGPAVRPIATAAELDALKKDHPVAVVLFSAAAGGATFEVFEETAKALRADYMFAIVTDKSIAGEEVEDDQIVLYKHFDEKRQAFSGEKTADALKAFIKEAGVPNFDQIGPHNYKMYLERKLPIMWVFATPADEAVLEAGRNAASAFRGKLSFVWIDSSKYAGMAQRLGLSGDKFPAVAIDNEGTHFALPVETTITAESLTKFAEDYLAGSLKPTIRSETAPTEHTVAGLTTVVGSTFQELVEEADQDVFIEFYAPWCGHCKQLAPVFEAAAKELENEPVRIAKMDATANDFPQSKFPVQGFPTMFFVPKATRVPVVYEGGRTQEALVSWLKEKMTA